MVRYSDVLFFILVNVSYYLVKDRSSYEINMNLQLPPWFDIFYYARQEKKHMGKYEFISPWFSFYLSEPNHQGNLLVAQSMERVNAWMN